MNGGMRFALAAAFFLGGGGTSAAPRREVALEEVRAAADRAAGFLLGRQASSGYFDVDARPGKGEEKTPQEAMALTALATMGLISVGHLPGDPTPEGEAVARSVDFLLRETGRAKDGYFGNVDGSRMYGHGIVTLLFAELFGMGVSVEQDALLRERCVAGVDLVLRAQQIKSKKPEHYGGWRYAPDAADSDISVSVWQVMALRAAKNAGFEVPKKGIDDAIDYIKRSASRAKREEGEPPAGGFSYQVGKNSPKMSTTAAGLLAMQICGEYEAPEVAAAAQYLLENPPEWDDSWFFYGIYYYAQGMYQRGGECEEAARETTESILLGTQEEDGSWRPEMNEAKQGPIYSTGLALLSLSVRYHLLPIYQR